MRITAARLPAASGSSVFLIVASRGGRRESLQISRTQVSTTSSRSRGIPNTSWLTSSIPSITVPPGPLAMLANSSAKSLRSGLVTRGPDNKTRLSSSVESSPSRIRRARSSWGIIIPLRSARLCDDSGIGMPPGRLPSPGISRLERLSPEDLHCISRSSHRLGRPGRQRTRRRHATTILGLCVTTIIWRVAFNSRKRLTNNS